MNVTSLSPRSVISTLLTLNPSGYAFTLGAFTHSTSIVVSWELLLLFVCLFVYKRSASSASALPLTTVWIWCPYHGVIPSTQSWTGGIAFVVRVRHVCACHDGPVLSAVVVGW